MYDSWDEQNGSSESPQKCSDLAITAITPSVGRPCCDDASKNITPTEATRLQRLWDSIHRRLADLAACRVMPPHVDRYEREQRLFGMLDAIEWRLGMPVDE